MESHNPLHGSSHHQADDIGMIENKVLDHIQKKHDMGLSENAGLIFPMK